MECNPSPRASESPTRTIDSANSTQASVETIVDRSNSATQLLNSTAPQLTTLKLENQSATMANSTNTTNNNFNKNSLTNSQISMISNDQKDSHIYTTPDLMAIGKTEKPLQLQLPLPSTPVKEIAKSIEQKLAAKSKNVEEQNSIRSKISIKSRKFPTHILLGVTQLVISIALVALGGLLLARGASLATTGSGIWAGAIAAISGALGVINVKKARTGFLAVSLICIASSTLAMALTGIGLVRDINQLEQKEINLQNTKSAISAGSGLIFALVLHFFVSILSVYQSAVKLCSRHPSSSQMLENVLAAHNASLLSQQKVEEYIKSIGLDQSGRIQYFGKDKALTPEECEKLMAMWLNSPNKRMAPSPMKPPMAPPRQIVLVPATGGNGLPPKMIPPAYRHPSMMFSPGILPPGVVGQSMPLPPLPPGSGIHPNDLKALYRIHGQRTTSEVSRHNKKMRSGKRDPNKRQRRKSESDAESRKAFTYTGLDRTIADNFLERQEMCNGSNVDYSSSSDSGRFGAGGDVVM